MSSDLGKTGGPGRERAKSSKTDRQRAKMGGVLSMRILASTTSIFLRSDMDNSWSCFLEVRSELGTAEKRSGAACLTLRGNSERRVSSSSMSRDSEDGINRSA